MAARSNRFDDAARAGWLYYVAGNTQDQIAAKLGVSRQSAQRLVSLARTEGLVRVHIDHPIAQCLELAERMRERYGVQCCEISPTDPGAPESLVGVAESGAEEIERWLRREDPIVMAVGTGRTLKAAVDLLPRMECRHHRVVSLTGAITPQGTAAYYNVVFTLSDRLSVKSFPLSLPVLASSPEERAMLHRQPIIGPTIALAAKADVTFTGIGTLDDEAALFLDGFLTRDEVLSLQRAGAAGEIVGWAYDADGQLIRGGTNDRVASAPIPRREDVLVIALAKGRRKVGAIAGALRGGLVNGLITDEATAQALLAL